MDGELVDLEVVSEDRGVAGKEVVESVEVVADPEPAAARTGDTTLHWSMLLSAACVMTLAAILQVRGPETVVIPVVDVALPGTCTYKRMMGADCPGCGLTRCFISMAHGRPTAAWYFNPAGILFFLMVAGQIPFRGLQIWRIRRGLAEVQLGRLGHFLMVFLMVALLAQWIVRSFFL